MTTIEFDLFGPVITDREKDAICALLVIDPKKRDENRTIVSVIADAVKPDGTVTANDWRPHMPTWINPRRVAAIVNALGKKRVLVPTGRYVRSDDVKGRNSNKPMYEYEWRGAP